MNFLKKILFSIRYFTLKSIIVCPDDKTKILVYFKGRAIKLKRKCPHQGAPLEKGSIKNQKLICPWHGCEFKLTGYRQ